MPYILRTTRFNLSVSAISKRPCGGRILAPRTVRSHTTKLVQICKTPFERLRAGDELKAPDNNTEILI
jgi:hypothetical protein